MSKVQEGLLYSESHEWVRIEGANAFIGISDFAQEETPSPWTKRNLRKEGNKWMKSSLKTCRSIWRTLWKTAFNATPFRLPKKKNKRCEARRLIPLRKMH